MTRKIAFLFVLFCCSLFCSSLHAQAIPGYTQISSGVLATTYADTTCADAQKCFYYVTAVDALGESAPSSTVNATVPAASTIHTVTLSWTASAGTGITYNVYKGAVPLPPQGLAATAQ